MERTCIECIFAHVADYKTYDGDYNPVIKQRLECRKNPPSSSIYNYKFPIVDGEDMWCYEFASLTEEDEFLKELDKIDAEFESPDWSEDNKE